MRYTDPHGNTATTKTPNKKSSDGETSINTTLALRSSITKKRSESLKRQGMRLSLITGTTRMRRRLKK